MTVTIGLDVNAARLSHLKWELALEALVRGEDTPEPLKGHEDCDVGMWIYRTGLKRHGANKTIWQLKDAHKRFHGVAEDVMAAVQAKDSAQTEALMARVRSHSNDIVYLFTALELDVVEAAANREQAFPLVAAIRGFLGRPKRLDIYSMLTKESAVPGRLVLNVSGARLAHLKWVRDVQLAFRGHGRNVMLQPSEECDLGIWIHGTALKELGQIKDLLDLDAAHKRFHQSIHGAVSALRHRSFRRADEAYEEGRRLSEEIVMLLTRLELAFEDSRSLSGRVQSLV